MCMSMRGIRKPGAKTITSAVRGQLRDAATRSEAMSLIMALAALRRADVRPRRRAPAGCAVPRRRALRPPPGVVVVIVVREAADPLQEDGGRYHRDAARQDESRRRSPGRGGPGCRGTPAGTAPVPPYIPATSAATRALAWPKTTARAAIIGSTPFAPGRRSRWARSRDAQRQRRRQQHRGDHREHDGRGQRHAAAACRRSPTAGRPPRTARRPTTKRPTSVLMRSCFTGDPSSACLPSRRGLAPTSTRAGGVPGRRAAATPSRATDASSSADGAAPGQLAPRARRRARGRGRRHARARAGGAA